MECHMGFVAAAQMFRLAVKVFFKVSQHKV